MNCKERGAILLKVGPSFYLTKLPDDYIILLTNLILFLVPLLLIS